MNNLIYIVYDRGFRLATYDFKEAINTAFSDSSLVVFDLQNKTTLSDFYCTDDTLYELEAELEEKSLMDLIPDCKSIIDNLIERYEDLWNQRDEFNKKVQEKQEYEIYLKVKKRLGID